MSLRVLRRIQEDAIEHRQQRQQKPKPGQSKAQMKQKSRVTHNRTLANIMRRKTRGKPWKEARKQLIAEAKARKPNYIHDRKKIEGCRDCS